jgi:hypothetical protein
LCEPGFVPILRELDPVSRFAVPFSPAQSPARPADAAPSLADGVVTGAPNLILRLEGGVALALAAFGYARLGGGWLAFALLFLAPDLAMLGYFAGRRFGAGAYNAVHSYVLPVALAAAAWSLWQPIAVQLALIWIAHIGFDRILGYGLKYPDGFAHSHLGGAARAAGPTGP